MNYAAVVRAFSVVSMGFSVCALIAFALALALGESAQVFAFGATGVFIGVFAGTVYLLTPPPKQQDRPRDGLTVFILFWLLGPLMCAPPFLLGIAETSPLSAVHEAMSCLSTTGHSVVQVDTANWPRSLLAWRGLLHVMGTIVMIVGAVGVFAAINLGGPGIHRTELFTISREGFFLSLPKVIRVVTSVVIATTLVLAVGLLLTGMNASDALTEATSAISTGYVSPEPYARPADGTVSGFLLSIGLVVGALGLCFMLPLLRGDIVNAVIDPETLTLFSLIAFFAAAAFILDVNLLKAIGWSVSAISTSGIPLSDENIHQRLPLGLVVLPALIGGSAMSAAGGVKLARLVVLMRRAVQEFRQLAYRQSLVKFRFRRRVLSEKSVIGVWVYLIAYVIGVMGLVLAFSFQELSFGTATEYSVGALSNSGQFFGNVDGLSGATEFTLIIAMLLGRLEILALIPALSIDFWRR